MRKVIIGGLPVAALVIAIASGIRCGGDKSTSRPCYTLALTAQGSGHAEVQPGLSCYYDTTSLTLNAQPDPGWIFDNWSGDLTGSNNPTTITLSKNSTIAANFSMAEYTLGIDITPSNGGTVTKNPDSATYHLNDQVELTAVPSQGWAFVGWTGDTSGVDPTINVTITGDMSITASFEPGFILENEPDCGTDYVDNYNGGCNSVPPEYSQIAPGQAIAGRSGTFSYSGSDSRDTDWYRYVSTGSTTIDFKGTGDFYLQLYIIDGTSGCDGLAILVGDAAIPGDTAYTSANVGPGTYYMWVGPAEFTGWPCPTDYRVWFSTSIVTDIKNSPPRIMDGGSGWKASSSHGDD